MNHSSAIITETQVRVELKVSLSSHFTKNVFRGTDTQSAQHIIN